MEWEGHDLEDVAHGLAQRRGARYGAGNLLQHLRVLPCEAGSGEPEVVVQQHGQELRGRAEAPREGREHVLLLQSAVGADEDHLLRGGGQGLRGAQGLGQLLGHVGEEGVQQPRQDHAGAGRLEVQLVADDVIAMPNFPPHCTNSILHKRRATEHSVRRSDRHHSFGDRIGGVRPQRQGQAYILLFLHAHATRHLLHQTVHLDGV
mmetsp:Transcript_69612/g.194179  ORF Transcript_69612/g.194179 Transcript_69612/m.194179 type:complete len:205 (-) Transcript_69612:700-1314(-)